VCVCVLIFLVVDSLQAYLECTYLILNHVGRYQW
jgi:hypothetical protein